MAGGSCLCGEVRWMVDGPILRMRHCHCGMCRKAHAAPFATYAVVAAGDFRFLAGEDRIVRYRSSPALVRSFCGTCGSVVPGASGAEEVDVPAGGFDDDPGVRPSAHIFAASKAPWHAIADALPQYADYEGDPEAAPAAAAPAELPMRGSCLCGAVAFEVLEPFRAVHNCHCSRCRKARAAAHTTNGFVPADSLRFTRGEDMLRSYKVPEARSFTQVFCTVCGSGMPRFARDRGVAIVPLGALDTDPGRGAQDHIFVGSKAVWYEIADALPQFQESAS